VTTAVETPVKTCTKCRLVKDIAEFGVNQNRPDGRAARCRPCNAAASAAYRGRKHMKYCAECGRLKHMDQYPANPSRDDGRGTWCTPCHDEAGRRTRNAIALRRLRITSALPDPEPDSTEIGVVWQKRAACRGEDPDMFYDVGTGAEAAARTAALREEFCDKCPVARLCAAEGAATRSPYGVWGGLNREAKKRKTA
jgi:WhiB family redox-sensing transcriptional regulator